MEFFFKTNLSLHINDDYCVATVTHNKLFSISRQRMNTVNCDVSSCLTTEGFKCGLTFLGLKVPHLDGTI